MGIKIPDLTERTPVATDHVVLESGTSGTSKCTVAALVSAALLAMGVAGISDAKGAEFHNCLFRGKDLLAEFGTLEALSAKVQSGDFSNIYVGDYITKSIVVDDVTYNLTFRVADIDYFVHNGDQELTTHHLVLVPDEVFMTNQVIMNDTNTTESGFLGSKAWTTVIPKITAALQTAFGSAHVLKHRRCLTSTVDANAASAAGAGFVGSATACTWADAYACFMNEVMAYGSTAFSSSGRDVSDGNKQFALFRIAKSYLSKPRLAWWLSSVACSTYFALCYTYGTANYYHASAAGSWLGVRPYFLFS
ncbi:MAG: hypothetical protein IJ233_00040 [Pyramidobacter sp.]|nr:hypothetical protein [Pyramidobacter sp.]